MDTLSLSDNQHATGKPFRVDDVEPAFCPLPECNLAVSIQVRSGHSIHVMPERNLRALAPAHLGRPVEFVNQPIPDDHEDSIEDLLRLAGRSRREDELFVHPLIEAVHMAFAQHRPLILSPESIWMVISQGFAQHIQIEAERLRSRLVSHSGRADMQLTVLDLEEAHWPQYIAGFSSLIRNASDPVLHETLICDFSTTTPHLRTASEVAIMDAYERYFRYIITCVCGIPEITVTGTLDDWRRMRARIDVLATFDLEWWIDRVRPILDEFVRTAEGRPNRDFWKAIYKPKQVYGDKEVTGWIADLFPYLRASRGLLRNLALDLPRLNWAVPVVHGPSPARFPSGLSKVPVQVTTRSSDLGSVHLLAGFFGVGQRREDLALFPMISWAVGTPAQNPVAVEGEQPAL